MDKVLNCIQIAGLVVITGGTLIIGALVAPIVFKLLSRQEAGLTMIEIFTKFDQWIFVSAIIVATSKIMSLALVRGFNFMNAEGNLDWVLVISLIFTLVLLAICCFHKMILSPQLLDAYESSNPIFETLHQQSEALYKLNFLVGMVLLFTFVI